jgi:hypothetical protein
MSEGYAWAMFTCPLCGAWQLDAGSHETRAVVEALIGEHALAEHGFRTAAGFFAAVVEQREAQREAEHAARLAAPIALDDRLAAWAEARFRLDSLELAVLELHRLDRSQYEPACLSCGFDSCEDLIPWPCSTAQLFLEAAGLTEGSTDD